MNNKIKQAKELLEREGYKVISKDEDNSKWLKIPELKIEIEIEVHDKGKSWDDLELSKREDDLPTAEMCLFLMKPENLKYAKILKMDGSSSEDDFYIKQYSEVSKKSGYVAYFYADSGGSILHSREGSGGRYSGRGVRFVRKISNTSNKVEKK